MRKTVKFASIYGNDGVLRRQENGREGKNTEYFQLNGSLVARAIQVVAPTTLALTVPSFSNNGAYAVSWAAGSRSLVQKLCWCRATLGLKDKKVI